MEELGYDTPERPRDKHGVIKQLSLPQYHRENTLEPMGDWVLVATQAKAPTAEGVPVMDELNRMLMQRFVTATEAIACSTRYSAMRVMGGWTLNLRTGETVRVEPKR